MAKIIKATDYGYRKVIRVCSNPEEPEYVHQDSTQHPISNVNGYPVETCHYNWNVREFVWSREEMDTTTSTGKVRRKTNAELMKQIQSELAAVPSPTQIPGLAGLTLEA